MWNDRLHGFKRRDATTNEDLCVKLYADKRIIRLLNEIAKEYGDMFEWVCFCGAENETINCEAPNEQMTLYYDDKDSVNGGMEINFYLWGDNKRVIEIVAMTGHETDGDNEMVFTREWNISVCSQLWFDTVTITGIKGYLSLYKEGGVSKMISARKEAEEYLRLQKEQECQLLDELTPLVMAALNAEDIAYLIEHPTANYHLFGIGMWIRNKFLWSHNGIEPDDISQKIIERVLSQIVPDHKCE